MLRLTSKFKSMVPFHISNVNMIVKIKTSSQNIGSWLLSQKYKPANLPRKTISRLNNSLSMQSAKLLPEFTWYLTDEFLEQAEIICLVQQHQVGICRELLTDDILQPLLLEGICESDRPPRRL